MSESHDLIPPASVIRERLERSQSETARLKRLLKLAEEVEGEKPSNGERLKTVPPNGLKTDPPVDLKADAKPEKITAKV